MIADVETIAGMKSRKKKVITMVDLFCGAGGTTTGAVEGIRALGYEVDVTVVNHDQASIATHKLNHPDALHLCTGVDEVEPRRLFKRGALDILLASPECTNHSKAKGGKPRDDQSRASGWCILKWAEQVSPKIIIIENVWEYLDWGPIGSNGKPLKSKRGTTFRAWKDTLISLGYKVEWKKQVSANYGDPTTRERLIILCVLGKRKCIWPGRTHAPSHDVKALESNGDLFALNLRPWVPVRDIIDWKLKGEYIFNRKRSLADNTLARIVVGIEKQGLQPFLIPGFGDREGQTPRQHAITGPLPTLCAGGHFTLIEPFIVAMEHGGSVDSIQRTLRTITTAKGGAHALIDPTIIQLRGTSDSQLKSSAKGMEQTLGAITAGGVHHGIIEGFLVQCAHGNGSDANGNARRVKELSQTLPTVCGNRGDWAHIDPCVIKYYGTGTSIRISETLDTVTCKDRFGLAEANAEEPPEEIVIEVAVRIGEKHYALACIRGIWCLVCTRDGLLMFVAIRFRMLQPHELALAMGFRKDYQFASENKTVKVKQIGNAVTRRLARAHVVAAFSQDPDVSWLIKDENDEEERGAA